MRPLVCDVCGAVEQTGINNDGASISWYFRLIGRFYPKDLCGRCANDISNYLTMMNSAHVRQQQEEQKKKDKPKETVTEIPNDNPTPTLNKLQDDNNPATQ